MAGVYIHIPFCRKSCHYCSFHFSTSLKNTEPLVDAILKEIRMRKLFLDESFLSSIYFGGGTPSVLSASQIGRILSELSLFFNWDKTVEITLEANPEDLNRVYLEEIKSVGINRLSIGVQSFLDDDLIFMNRSHLSDQSFRCIKLAKSVGFESISIDLMFGLIGRDIKNWLLNLTLATALSPEHLSCYNLTIEEQTAFYHWKSKSILKETSCDVQKEQFIEGSAFLKDQGFEHYEISNFAKPGYRSKHNTNYWRQEKYLGLGPSAHSFNGGERIWNVANNKKYIESFQCSEGVSQREQLTDVDRYNEVIMLGLRTKWGVCKQKLEEFPIWIGTYFKNSVQKYIERGTIIESREAYVMNLEDWYITDDIASDLFWV